MELQGFSVIRRNYGHWDIVRQSEGLLFRLRGGPGAWRVLDERGRNPEGNPALPVFKEQSAAMAFICAELMHELLVAEGQQPHVIEGWNV